MEPSTTVVVVTWRGRHLVGPCLDALAAQTRAHAVLVVDNASADGTTEVLAAHPSAPGVLRLPRNAGYAGALAAALPKVRTPYVAWLNDDAEPEPGWLAELEAVLDSEPAVAAAASLLVLADGPALAECTVQSAGVWLTELGYGADLTALAAATPGPGGHARTDRQTQPHETADTAARNDGHALTDRRTRSHEATDTPAKSVEVFGFCGGAAIMRTEAVTAVGGVPGAFFCYYEDADTAWRLRLAGHRVVTVPTARVRHRHGASATHGSRDFHRWNERNRLLMLLRCAPAPVALRELGRFAAITAALLVRRPPPGRQADGPHPGEPPRDGGRALNYRVPLRLWVLAAVAARLPATIVQRAAVGRHAALSRREVWRAWAGR